MTKRVPCSDQALARNDPMYGTASAGSRWLLLELCGGWGHSAFLNSPAVIDPALGLAIVRRAEKAGMRIAAIRRPGRRPDAPRWRWFIARCDPGSEAVYRGEVDGPQSYLDLSLDGDDGTLSSEPVVMVCAHGKHDQCCAVRGRAACAAINAAYPDITWECSHLGGDRFAATMLILPEGLCYGRIDATDSADLVRRYLQGRVDNRFLRGRTAFPNSVQAAQFFARQDCGDDSIAGLAPVDVDEDESTVRVVLHGNSGPVEVRLGKELSEPLLSQCTATVAGAVRIFTLRSITPA